MKSVAFGLLVLGLTFGAATEAGAVTCARGVYRAGCVGPHGAAVVHHRPVAAATVVAPARVVRPVPHCFYRAGVRVCR